MACPCEQALPAWKTLDWTPLPLSPPLVLALSHGHGGQELPFPVLTRQRLVLKVRQKRLWCEAPWVEPSSRNAQGARVRAFVREDQDERW
jgi:hypothetical protein